MAKTLDELELRALLAADSAAPRAPSPYTDNARYLTSLDGFNIKRPAIPAHVFRAERDRALAPGAPTGLVPLDLSATLGLGYPATTPFILSRYARIRAGDTLSTAFRASTELYHVIRGCGHDADRRRAIARLAGGRHLLPARRRGGAPRRGRGHRALDHDQRAPARVRGAPAAGAGRGADPARPLPDGGDPAAAARRVPGPPRGGDAGQVDQPGERGPRVEPHHDAVLHARAELAPARRGAARPPAQRGGGDARPGRRALLFPDRRGARGLGAPHGDDHAARPPSTPTTTRATSWRSSSSSRTGASTTTAGRWASATSSPARARGSGAARG